MGTLALGLVVILLYHSLSWLNFENQQNIDNLTLGWVFPVAHICFHTANAFGHSEVDQPSRQQEKLHLGYKEGPLSLIYLLNILKKSTAH